MGELAFAIIAICGWVCIGAGLLGAAYVFILAMSATASADMERREAFGDVPRLPRELAATQREAGGVGLRVSRMAAKVQDGSHAHRDGGL